MQADVCSELDGFNARTDISEFRHRLWKDVGVKVDACLKADAVSIAWHKRIGA